MTTTTKPESRPDWLSKSNRMGLLAGVVAVIAAGLVLQPLSQVPFGLLALNLLLAWGFVGYLAWLHARGMRLSNELLIVAAISLAAALIAARLVPRWGPTPFWFNETLTLPAIVVVASLGAYASLAKRFSSRLAAIAVITTLTLSAVGIVTWHAIQTPSPVESVLLLVLAVTGVALALMVQAAIAGKLNNQRLTSLNEPGALAMAASQLLDGLVTYLAINNPLGLAPSGLREQVALSAWVLENAGPMYPIIKWALGAAVYLALRPGEWTDKRVGLFMLLLYTGLMPGIFSASNVL